MKSKLSENRGRGWHETRMRFCGIFGIALATCKTAADWAVHGRFGVKEGLGRYLRYRIRYPALGG